MGRFVNLGVDVGRGKRAGGRSAGRSTAARRAPASAPCRTPFYHEPHGEPQLGEDDGEKWIPNNVPATAGCGQVSGTRTSADLINLGPPANQPPSASAGENVRGECLSSAGSVVVLDGRASTDADSTPGTSDDIVSYDWYEDYDTPAQRLLGRGPILELMLSLGGHEVTLQVTDRAGESDMARMTATVQDTIPPALELRSDPPTLWPPHHGLPPVHVTWTAEDLCDPAVRLELVSVMSSEPDDAPGDSDGGTTGDVHGADPGSADPEILLRAVSRYSTAVRFGPK